jgi:spermidine synthase
LSSQSAPLAAPAPSTHADRPAAAGTGALLAVFTVAVFLSAFLLFLVQPMFGKMVLPLLGGSPAVWNTCMLFFQAALLGGYLYAHLSSRWTVRRQAMVHLALLALAALALPVSVRGAAPPGGGAPIPWLLGLMAMTVGAPFLVLSGTGVVLQRWFSRSGHAQAAEPYQLYAASNLGSALALLAYPFLMEPRMRLAGQSGAWTVGYALLALLVGACAWRVWRTADAPGAVPSAASPEAVAEGARSDAAPTWRERMVWTGLAFIPSSLLLAVTTYVTTDLSPAPLLWVLPLALYLLTFTLVFARRPLLKHAWMVAIHPSAIAVVVLLLATGYVKSPAYAVPLHLLSLFVIAMTAHGELARRRPHARHLTEFYLWLSVGGVLGGVFNALIAPVVFDHLWEYPIVLGLACLARPWPEARLRWREHLWAAVRAAAFAYALIYLSRTATLAPLVFVFAAFALIMLLNVGMARTPGWLMACIAAALFFRAYATLTEPGVLLQERTFFGRYKVMEYAAQGGFNVLRHGSTLHGAQSRDPSRRREPLTYYLRNGPLGQILYTTVLQEGRRRVAVVGLGTGTTGAYAAKGEEWTFYEIDPGIEAIARDTSYFSFLSDMPVEPRIVLGDARLQLARDTARTYDVILLDAFSSDAIPVHLMTLEALDTYLARLAPDGMVAFHVSNRHLDLEPVVAALARARGLVARAGQGPRGMRDLYESNSTWIALARRETGLGHLATDLQWWEPRLRDDVEPWTDDYSSLLTVFEW